MSQRQHSSSHSQSNTPQKKDQSGSHVQVIASFALKESTLGKVTSNAADKGLIYANQRNALQLNKTRAINPSPVALFPQIATSEQYEYMQQEYGKGGEEGAAQGYEYQYPQPNDGLKNVRQLSKFNVLQRLSNSQANSGQKQWDNNQNFIVQQIPTNIDSLLIQQTRQHNTYISRQYQGVGVSTSNGSYVFNDGSTQRTGLNKFIAGEVGNTQQTQMHEGDVTQESFSPGSIQQGRNFVFKNVRNYSNLYENRQLVSKNTELQDKMRLGTKRLWTVKRADLFLPSIHSDGVSLAGQKYANTQIFYQGDTISLHSSTDMIQRKKSFLENGQLYIQNELSQSRVQNSHLEKPGTHHGYQSTHYTGQLTSTDPTFRQNMTSSSFNKQETGKEASWKTYAMNTPFMPDLSISSNFRIEKHINQMKPVLRRNCLHNRNNIVIQWKSFEVWIARLEYSAASDQAHNKLVGRKMLHPVYVPISELSYMMTLSPSQIELRIAKSLKFEPIDTQFVYIPIEIPVVSAEQASPTFSRKHSQGSPTKVGQTQAKFAYMHDMSPGNSKGKSSELDQSFGSTGFIQTAVLEDKLPEEIQTSLYLQQTNADFQFADHQIIIRPPCLEYIIPSKNFLFVKTLTREENNEFIQNKFKDWQEQAISCLSRYTKFNELLAIIEKDIDYKHHLMKIEAEQSFQKPKDLLPENMRLKKANIRAAAARRDQAASPSQMQIYLLEQASGKILDYNSLSEFKRKRFFENKSGNTRGFFSQNNSLGQIEIKPFAVVIKSLDSSYEYRHNFGIASGHWSKIIGFMQLKALKRPQEPQQLVDKVCKHFIKSLVRADLNSSTIAFRATSILTSKKQIQDPGLAKKSAYPLLLKEEKINEKVNEIAQISVCEPSKTVHKLADLRINGVAVIPDKSSDLDAKKQQIPQEQQKDSIEQQRKRFSQDSKQALRSFLQLQKRSKMLPVPDKKDPSTQIRYLVELEFPVCYVSFQGQNYCKPLIEEDLLHLVSTHFCRWKNYLMTKHFRLELNIGQEKPLPKIMEDKRGEDDLISETDPREKFPITEAEKPKIEQTRVQVTSWFPV